MGGFSTRGAAGRVRALARCCAASIALGLALPAAAALRSNPHPSPEPGQETGFLNRRIEIHGVTYKFQVYLPEEWRRDDHKLWPIILALHGRGERGSEGMWQTQIGLPQAVRDHPERWPFVIVMPQCLQPEYWTDPPMMALALAALEQETQEFHGDPERTYLTGLSLGGYGAWELALREPRRWAAIAIAASGVFWSYAPERWQLADSLPEEYARAVGSTPVWLFHGMDDNVVPPRESELMYEALKANGGHVRLWVYQGLRHDCWTRAYNEPELPRWLLSHRLGHPAPGANQIANGAANGGEPQPFAERIVVPLHPASMKLPLSVLDSYVGEYRDMHGGPEATIVRQGENLYLKNRQGETDELAAESPAVFFYPNGNPITRIIFEHDREGRVTAAILHDDRHEERWERRITSSSR
jgi:pimeloyl-ACP methyl ester carboxylesterase